MKITKSRLRQIIKEEVYSTRSANLRSRLLREQIEANPQEVQDMAIKLSKNPAVMALVKKAAKDPEIQKLVAKAVADNNAEMNEDDKYKRRFHSAVLSGAAGAGALATGIGMTLSDQMMRDLAMAGHQGLLTFGDPLTLALMMAGPPLMLAALGFLFASEGKGATVDVKGTTYYT